MSSKNKSGKNNSNYKVNAGNKSSGGRNYNKQRENKKRSLQGIIAVVVIVSVIACIALIAILTTERGIEATFNKGEEYVSLHENGSFTSFVGGTSFSGTYTYDDGEITFLTNNQRYTGDLIDDGKTLRAAFTLDETGCCYVTTIFTKNDAQP